MNPPRVFTLEAANRELPEVLRITQECIERLAAVAAVWGKLPFRKFNAIAGAADEDLIQAEWALRIAERGILPKGFFVVDFASPDANTFYCWAYGEDSVAHQHKVWETFADRVAIECNREMPIQPVSQHDEIGGDDGLADDVVNDDAMRDDPTRDET